MSGTPPLEVRHRLRHEVGFGCPVPLSGDRCGNPFLRWHHFDPPWHVRPHYVPEGMVALCRAHHQQAQAGRFTVEELRSFKHAGRDASEEGGRWTDWTRQKVLAVVGGNFYYETPVALQIGPQPVVAFERDADGRLLLHINMPSTTGEPRVRIDRSDWIETGLPTELECAPGERSLRVRYAAGDVLAVELREVAAEGALRERYGDSALAYPLQRLGDRLEFPLLALEVTLQIVGVLDLGPLGTRVSGGEALPAGAFAANGAVGLQL